MNWNFIMQAGTNLALYGRKGERLLVDTTTMGVVMYYTLDGKVLITSGVTVLKEANNKQ